MEMSDDMVINLKELEKYGKTISSKIMGTIF